MSRRAPSQILLIVDEPAALDALRDSLTDPPATTPAETSEGRNGERASWDLQVDSAPQGSEGVNRVRQAIWERRPYAMVIVDLRGPASQETAQTVRQLAEIDADLAILLGHRGQADAELAQHPQTLDRLLFLPDNTDRDALRQLVAAQLDRRQAHEDLRRTHLELESTRRALERMREEAEEAEQVKQQLLANISHEIRTPMNAILGFTRLLLKEPLPNEHLERLRYVADAGNSLMRLIEGVLDFSKLSTGKLHLDRSAFHLETAIGLVLDGVRRTAADKGLELYCHIDRATPLRLRGDAGRFREVLANLVGNAVKFTEHGTVQLRVSADEDGEDSVTLRVVVTDTGIGIPLDRQAKVFRSFSQVDGSATREFGGIGLGLALSKRLLELMGGQIGFRSTPGQGSTFWFTIPFDKDRVRGGERVEALRAESLLPPAQPNRGLDDYLPKRAAKQPRILVAEDERLDRLLLEALLSRTGALVDLVGNGREAIAVLKSNDYDLVFMDMEMPEVDGLTAIRRIRQAEAGSTHHLPIVALTANSEPSDREACLAAGADQYVAKPFSAEALLDALDRWLPGLLESSRREETGPDGNDADAPSLSDCVARLRGALSLPDFRELDAQAQTVKRLVSGGGAVADLAMRVQLAARRGDLDQASTAVERLDRAVRGIADGVRQEGGLCPVPVG